MFKNKLKQMMVLVFTCLTVGCVESDIGLVLPFELPNWDIAWTDKFKGTQIDEMRAVDMAMDSKGNTYTLGTMDLLDGTDWGTLLKYDAAGNRVAEQVFQASGDARTRPTDMAMDSNGDIVVVGRRDANDSWFVSKFRGSDLALLWQTTTNSGSAEHVAVGDSGQVYVAGHSGDRYATAGFNGSNGQKYWSYNRGCCSNGAIKRSGVYDSAIVNDANGKEWFYVTYPGINGSKSSPQDMEIKYYHYDVGSGSLSSGQRYVDVDADASDYQLLVHPQGYIVFAGNRGSYTKIYRIDYGTSGLSDLSLILQFSKPFVFRALNIDDQGSLYIGGDTTDESINGYIAKYHPSCISNYSYLCWDHTFNHTLLFNVNVSLLGKDVIDTFSDEEVREVMFADNIVYLLTSSETSDSNVASKRISELVGYDMTTGEGLQKIQISASDSVGARVSPLNNKIHVVGVNKNADLTADPDIYLYTRAIWDRDWPWEGGEWPFDL